jgi:hypothetical protein
LTLPVERTRSVIQTEKFLKRLCDPKVTPGLPKTIRAQAKMLLRHYPTVADLHLTHRGWHEKLLAFVLAECPFGEPDDYDNKIL